MSAAVRSISKIFKRLFVVEVQRVATMSNNIESDVQDGKVVVIDNRDVTPQVHIAADSLLGGHIIAVPTDTIYGIAGLAQSVTAMNKIYEIKKRDLNKPVAICVGEIKDVYKWCKVTISDELMSELLPGPVTLVFERTAELNPGLNPMTSLVGVRIPDHTFVTSLATVCGQPLALTSANISAAQSTLNVQEFGDIWLELDKIFDGGTLGNGPLQRFGSTVIDLSCFGKYKIIRPGSAHKASLEKLHKHSLEELT